MFMALSTNVLNAMKLSSSSLRPLTSSQPKTGVAPMTTTPVSQPSQGLSLASQQSGIQQAAATNPQLSKDINKALSTSEYGPGMTQSQATEAAHNVGATYDPNSQSSLRNERAQGANVGDIRDFDGVKWRWNGEMWEKEPGQSTGNTQSAADVLNTKYSGEDRSAIENILGGAGNAASTLSDLEKQARETGANLADLIEKKARESADAQYGAILSALGVQKGEVQKVGSEQSARAKEEAALGQTELTARETQGVSDIEKEKTGFVKQQAQDKEQLARNWRDLSLELQRVMRARGVQDSSYSGDKEAKLMGDFNKGLQVLAVKGEDTLKDFSDAITQTHDYYKRQQDQLDFQLRGQLSDIDTYVRQEVQKIQGQEGIALANKFSQINDAITQGQQLKTQIELKLLDQKASYAMWLDQVRVQYQTAVATAALGSVGSAKQKIADIAAYQKVIQQGLSDGSLSLMQTTLPNGNVQAVVHGTIGGQTITEPVSSEFVTTQQSNQSLNLATNVGKAANSLGLTSGTPEYNTFVSQYLPASSGVTGAIAAPQNKFLGLF